MLFTESRVSRTQVKPSLRLRLFDRLQERGLVPLVRSTRLNAYELALLGPDGVSEMEEIMAARAATEDIGPYVKGDLFCFEDFVLFLVFGERDDAHGMRAGIVHAPDTTEPLKKLGAFCRNVADSLRAMEGHRDEISHDEDLDEWLEAESRRGNGDDEGNHSVTDESFAGLPEVALNHPRAAEMLEDPWARRFLHRLREAHPEGRVADLLASDNGHEAATEALINRLAGAGLLRREVVVSCRKMKRALFRLPSPEVLSVITSSNAMCSECGAAIADEKIEELVKPTDVATALLEDGSWLARRLSALLREFGIPARDIVSEPTSGDGEAHLVVRTSGQLFLLVLRDGDFTSANALHALDQLIAREASHMIVVSTGKIQEEARLRLREHERRRARQGAKVEVLPIEGLDQVSTEISRIFTRVAQRMLADDLCELDASLGASAGYLIATRFQLMKKTGALTDVAASAVGALANSLREI